MIVILLAYSTVFAQNSSEKGFKAKYGLTTSIQGPDAVIGVSIPLSSTFSVIPTVGFNYNLDGKTHNEVYGVALQINMGSNKLVPYTILRYGYSSDIYSSYGVGYGGEYYFLPRVSANIELQLNMVENTISTGTALGVTYYFGE